MNPKCGKVPNSFYYIDLECVNAGEIKDLRIEIADTAPSRAQRLLALHDILFQTVRPYQKNNYHFKVENDLPTVASTGYAVFRTHQNSEYLYELIHTERFLSDIMKRCTGTSFPAVSSSDIEDIAVWVPEIQEQKKVGEFLTLVDAKIAKQRLLIEHLKKYKRGVISKLFSREIRFTKKDGSSFPEWREYPLDSVVEFLDGQRKPLESAERAHRKGAYPYYGASGIIDYIDNYIFDEPLLLLGEDGANIITRSSPLCFIATGKYWVNNHAHVMRPKQGFDLRFVCEALESIDYTKYNTGTAQPKLNQEKCRQILFTYPCYEEQQCISSFLSSITKRIMDSEEQLYLLETQKKSLLQQLFI